MIFSGNIIVQVKYNIDENFITFSEFLNNADETNKEFSDLIEIFLGKDKNNIKEINFYYIEDEQRYLLHSFKELQQAQSILKVVDTTEVSFSNLDYKLCKIFEVR